MPRLQGKIAVVSGGSTGIGLATAQRFVEEGAHVFIAGRRQAELAKAAEQIGRNVSAVQCDVAKLDDLDRLFGRVRNEKGRVDILFANSGIMEFQKIGEITPEHVDRTFAVNVRGLLFTVQKALPLMESGGSIILTASIGSMKAWPGYSVYSASKAAIRSFARSWMLELKDRGIRVNAVSPRAYRHAYLRSLGQGEEPRGEGRLRGCSPHRPDGTRRGARRGGSVPRLGGEQLRHR
jgi:NAD(P)-dependent dehydrogenase (short-subunit alcohol dehydrogenase family)